MQRGNMSVLDPSPDYTAGEFLTVRTRIAGLQQQLSDCERRGERFRLLIENATDYAFITFDAENRISSWNLGAERVLGYSESEMMGQNGDVLFTPEDRATGAAAQEFETARTEGRAKDERWHLRKDGSRFWASGVLMCLQPGQPANGNGQYSFGKLLRDLTERKEAEERLRQSEERFRLFLENVRDCALFQLDPHGNISVWNPGAERLFGYSEQEIVGECIKVLFPPDELSQRSIDEELKRVLTYDRAEEEQWLIRKNGSRFFARWTTNLMRDDEGQIRVTSRYSATKRPVSFRKTKTSNFGLTNGRRSSHRSTPLGKCWTAQRRSCSSWLPL
jgi:PAS domain S-box-containing protein